MGKTDGCQTKLQLDSCRSACILGGSSDHMGSEDSRTEVTTEKGDMKSLRMAMQQSLMSIESKMDNMCTRMDVITNKLEKQDGRIMETEHRISAVEDAMSTRGKQLLNMEKVLKLISAKNEDLEVRYHRNKLSVIWIP
ncbi:hypothetical protein NDU88_000608 [Pleurodeles waltl]|uniref:Uncharacterized protein n=1 Tax=Pleurodeles waltl TaxID=8319 RepID=A0AAV7P5G4_PLEWA|nr:hypothetical protein NDU88_000608 [Pleurodeles waltl]